ncbi:hypothetical protein [Rhodopirellula baltica]
MNTGSDHDDAERLHHWLHLIAESSERDVMSVLVDAITETFGADAMDRLLPALEEQSKPMR